jgi:hypothetical protein
MQGSGMLLVASLAALGCIAFGGEEICFWLYVPLDYGYLLMGASTRKRGRVVCAAQYVPGHTDNPRAKGKRPRSAVKVHGDDLDVSNRPLWRMEKTAWGLYNASAWPCIIDVGHLSWFFAPQRVSGWPARAAVLCAASSDRLCTLAREHDTRSAPVHSRQQP